MQQVADWLQKLGLGQYAQPFAENDIDVSVLPHLTDADLEKIGVSLGHRRKFLAAIAEIPVQHRQSRQKSRALSSRNPQETAERRQVTVMFSDLVGSTALSARMDPEDLREVISAYQKCVAETVQRFGGFVAKYMGDGVLVYLGLPPGPRGRRRESSARRAGVGARCWRPEDPCAPADARRHRNGPCGCRGPHRLRRFSGASHCWRDAEPCRTLAEHCGAEQRGDCRKYPQARGQSVRA